MPNKLQILGLSVCLLFVGAAAYLGFIVQYEYAPLLAGLGGGIGIVTGISGILCRFRRAIQQDPKTYVNRRDQLRILFIVFGLSLVSFIGGELSGRSMVKSQIKRCMYIQQSRTQNIHNDIALECIINNVNL